LKALVTGGCGFIGSHLVDSLIKSGHEIVIVDNLLRGRYLWSENAVRPRLVESSILDRGAMLAVFAEFKPDMVFHMAAHHFIPFCEQNPFEAFETNVRGTLNIVDAATQAGSVKKFFLASTGDVYAPCTYAHAEIDPPAPVYVYGETKLVCETVLRRYKSSVKVPFDVTIGRLFNAAGSRETNPHFLPEVMRQLDAGASVIEVGNTWPMRDFVDVRSMAKVIQALTEKTTGIDVYNIGSGHAMSVQSALEILIEASGRAVKIVPVEARKRPNDRPYLCPSVSKITNLLGFACEGLSVKTAKAIWDEPIEQRRLYC